MASSLAHDEHSTPHVQRHLVTSSTMQKGTTALSHGSKKNAAGTDEPAAESDDDPTPPSFANLDEIEAPLPAITEEEQPRLEDEQAETRDTRSALANLDEIEAPQPVYSNEGRPSLEQRFEAEKQHRTTNDRSPTSSSTQTAVASGGDEIAAEGGVGGQHSHRQSEYEEKRETNGERGNTLERLIGKERMTMFCTASYLVFFALLGTLARLGLQALTIYPGAPVALGELWANVAGTAVMGFLAEDRALFAQELERAAERRAGNGDGERVSREEFIRTQHVAVKKQIPLYLGLTVGFCGCFTTFSSFMRDAFLALSNDLDADFVRTTASAAPRNDGRSVEAVLAVLILEVATCLVALDFGAHVAMAVERPLRGIARVNWLKALDLAVVVVAWPAWMGAVMLAIWPPHDRWRGIAVFALVFGPVGCLLRFVLSMRLNALVPRFPLGTFVANVFGTLVLAASWDLQHAGIAGNVGCQVLQGVQDGFCGCLTTVSTWMLELKGLRRLHAYVYGACSVAIGLAVVVVVMGSLRWADGFDAAQGRT